MNSGQRKKEGVADVINLPTIITAILALLLMQGAAQAWWARATWIVWRGGW